MSDSPDRRSVLVSPQDIADFYHELWAECHETPPPGYLRHGAAFPPFLCRSLAFGHPELPSDCGRRAALTGRGDGEYLMIESGPVRLFWGTAKTSNFIFEGLSLDGHRLAPPTDLREQCLRRAADVLSSLSSPAAESVSSYIGLLVWLETESDATPSITSSSFPPLPHLTAVTDGSARELLPGSFLPQPGGWVLAEDLYHESLHQQLTATTMIHDIFAEDYVSSNGPLVDIPWRGARWPVDRALHALFVYSHIVELRTNNLHEADLPLAEREAVADALPGAIEAMTHLADQLPSQGACFTPIGRELLGEVIDESCRVLSASAAGSPS